MTDFNATVQKVQARFNCDKGAAIAIIGRMRKINLARLARF